MAFIYVWLIPDSYFFSLWITLGTKCSVYGIQIVDFRKGPGQHSKAATSLLPDPAAQGLNPEFLSENIIDVTKLIDSSANQSEWVWAAQKA